MNVKELTAPLKGGYKWKIQSFNKDKTSGMCVPFFDARDVENRLDDVCGIFGWKDEYYQVKETMFCRISIKDGNEWISKSGAGVEKKSYDNSDEIKYKGEASDAFKLAGVKWGIFRDSYEFDKFWVDVRNKKPVDKKGRQIKDLTEYITAHLRMTPEELKASKIGKEDETETKPTGGIKMPDGEFGIYKTDTVELINTYFNEKKFGNKTKTALIAETMKAASNLEVKLVQHRLDLIDYFIELRPFIDDSLQEHYINSIMKMTITSFKDLKSNLGKLLNKYKGVTNE